MFYIREREYFGGRNYQTNLFHVGTGLHEY